MLLPIHSWQAYRFYPFVAGLFMFSTLTQNKCVCAYQNQPSKKMENWNGNYLVFSQQFNLPIWELNKNKIGPNWIIWQILNLSFFNFIGWGSGRVAIGRASLKQKILHFSPSRSWWSQEGHLISNPPVSCWYILIDPYWYLK